MSLNSLKSGITKLHFYGSAFLNSFIFYGGKLAGRVIFPFLLIKNSATYIHCNSYFPECELKSKFRIAMEQLIHIMQTGEINRDYFIRGFDRKSKNDFNNYIPWLTFTHARNTLNQRMELKYDPYNYVCLLRDKFVFEAYCKRVNLNTPENIGLINEGQVYLLEKKKFFPISAIVNFNLDIFCKKNVSYGGGFNNNVFKVQIRKGEITINKTIKSLQEFVSLIGDDHWTLQKCINNQETEYARFHPQSINTIRIVTVKKDFDIDILYALFRTGVNDSMTDNWSSGGISVGINVESGTLKKFGLYNPTYGTKTEIHPDSKIVFERYKLPLWEEIKEYVKNAHRLFYGFHSVGWDVAVTADGITIIEGNDNWNTSGAQRYNGMKKEFIKYFKAKT